jgi:hypothetical protein
MKVYLQTISKQLHIITHFVINLKLYTFIIRTKKFNQGEIKL